MKLAGAILNLGLFGLLAVLSTACNSDSFTLSSPSGTSATGTPTVNTLVSASAIYGQADFNTNNRLDYSLSKPTDPILIGSKLVVPDTGNHRVLIWNSIPTSATQAPNVILGQVDRHANLGNGPTPLGSTPGSSGYLSVANSIGMNSPTGVCSDGTKLVVADTNNSRVMIWNKIPTFTGTPADVVLGQPDFASNGVNVDGTVNAKGFRTPSSLSCSTGRLFVSDTGNHRVLFWNSIPTTNYQAADGVLGQPGFTTFGNNQGGTESASTMNGPRGIATSANKLFVVDSTNYRILVWNTLTPASQQPADGVLGQTLFSTRTANLGGISGHSLYGPQGIGIFGTALYVTDYLNHRVLIWDTIPLNATTNANRVLGQADFSTNTVNAGGITAQSFNNPRGAASDGTKLVVTDPSNNRLFIYNSLPTNSNQAADLIWGQVRPNLITINGGIDPNLSLNLPTYFGTDGSHLWINDSKHCRHLRYPANKTPFDGMAPDLILGQADLLSTGCDTSASQTGGVGTVISDGVKLYVADSSNNRILIWNTYPTVNNAPADAVIGQPDFVSSTANNGALGASSINTSYSVTIASGKLIAADTNNHRVLIWNTLPSGNTSANVVLGQSGFTTNAASSTASGMNTPTCVHYYSGKLFVCDRLNNRILVWNTIPTVNGTAADFVIGQSNFTDSGVNANQTTINASGFNNALDIAYNGKKLFVTDLNNSRILVWNKLPSANGVPADSVIGQSNLVTGNVNFVTLSKERIWRPFAVTLNGSDLFVSDYMNHRLLKYSGIDP